MVDTRLRTSDGVSNAPWRTRGAFNPNSLDNASNSNLPVAADVTVGPDIALAPYDSFIITDAFSYTGLGNGSQTVAAGDRLAYLGGDGGPTAPSNWVVVKEAYMHPVGCRVIAQRYAAFDS